MKGRRKSLREDVMSKAWKLGHRNVDEFIVSGPSNPEVCHKRLSSNSWLVRCSPFTMAMVLYTWQFKCPAPHLGMPPGDGVLGVLWAQVRVSLVGKVRTSPQESSLSSKHPTGLEPSRWVNLSVSEQPDSHSPTGVSVPCMCARIISRDTYLWLVDSKVLHFLPVVDSLYSTFFLLQWFVC